MCSEHPNNQRIPSEALRQASLEESQRVSGHTNANQAAIGIPLPDMTHRSDLDETNKRFFRLLPKLLPIINGASTSFS